ncbi:uncharacterized protein LOC118181750 [Stegodyphus dumicola]|uniref:uncharacterized protein LOC118181750 n=1 Tax=Stegodyphus dumicola TaxID=202533 RepID=UPI0015A7BE4B|nr:uncharacterized protein LOC118181750 [Stegodyphus dumicola]
MEPLSWVFPMTARKIRTLNSIQRPFLINITRSFSTTSTNALQTIAGVTPLPIQTEIHALSTLILQLKKTSTYNGVIFNPQEYEEKPPKYNRHSTMGLHNLHCNLNKPPPSTDFAAYTDGSKIENKVGSSVTIKTKTRKKDLHSEWQGYLRPQNSVYQADLIAILNSIMQLSDLNTDTIHVITDSQSSIHSIKQQHTNSPIARQIQDIVSTSNEKFVLSWTRGHNACKGNERVDYLAKQAALEQTGSQIQIPWPKPSLKYKLKQMANEKWQRQWEQGPQGRHTFELLPKADENTTISTYFLTQYISGHGPFPKYFYDRKYGYVGICGESGDPEHYIFQCPLMLAHHIRHPIDTGIEFRKFIIKHRKVFQNIKNIIHFPHRQGLDLCHL